VWGIKGATKVRTCVRVSFRIGFEICVDQYWSSTDEFSNGDRHFEFVWTKNFKGPSRKNLLALKTPKSSFTRNGQIIDPLGSHFVLQNAAFPLGLLFVLQNAAFPLGSQFVLQNMACN
jgi:hypothetical protein